MGKFRLFIEDLQGENVKKLQAIWADTFKALGVGGLGDEDAAQQSLSRITYGGRNGSDNTVFKGKQAVRKRLENGQIFNRLAELNDPELKAAVEDARKWLDTNDNENGSNASTTVSMLLQKMFGTQYFQQFIDKDFPKIDDAKAQVQPQPPKDTPTPSPDGSLTQSPDVSGQQGAPDPNGGPPGSQPQVQQNMIPPKPNNPLPQKPAGGLF